MRARYLPALLILITFLFATPREAFAQDTTVAVVYTIKPKNGMGQALATAIRQHSEWRKAQGDPWTWIVYEVVNGPNIGTFIGRSGSHRWSDFDDYAEFSQKATLHFQAVAGPVIDSVGSSMTTINTNVTRWPADALAPTLLNVATYHLKPGQGPVFNEAVQKFHDAIVERDFPAYYSVVNLVNGGPGPRITIVGGLEGFAGMQAPDPTLQALMVDVYGAEETKRINEQFTSAVTGWETSLIVPRLDLSVVPN
jgi:hypothetical protein